MRGGVRGLGPPGGHHHVLHLFRFERDGEMRLGVWVCACVSVCVYRHGGCRRNVPPLLLSPHSSIMYLHLPLLLVLKGTLAYTYPPIPAAS